MECQNVTLNLKNQVGKNIQNTLPHETVVNEMILRPERSSEISVLPNFLYMIIINLWFLLTYIGASVQTILEHQPDQIKLPEHQTTVISTACRCSNVVCRPSS